MQSRVNLYFSQLQINKYSLDLYSYSRYLVLANEYPLDDDGQK